MPVIMFDWDDILVVFENTFVADTHEAWFDHKIWKRVRVDHENPHRRIPDHRGDGYLAKFKDATIPSFIVQDL